MPYIARQSFSAPNNRVISKGQEVADDDPIIEGREALFAHTDTPPPSGPVAFGPGGVPIMGPPESAAVEEPKPRDAADDGEEPAEEKKPARGRRTQKKAEESA